MANRKGEWAKVKPAWVPLHLRVTKQHDAWLKQEVIESTLPTTVGHVVREILQAAMEGRRYGRPAKPV